MKTRRGVAAVEFALVLPLFIFLLLATVDYGWFFMIELATTNAVREGARAATTYPGACPNAAGQAAARSVVTTYLRQIGQDAKATTDVTCTTGAVGEPVFQVVTTVLMPQLTGYSLIPMPKTGALVRASAQVTMRGVP